MKTICLFIIQFYRVVISPLLPVSCRFYPSCSAYSYEAVQRFGTARGITLAVKRVIRCHPYNDGGYDPVPPVREQIEIEKVGGLNEEDIEWNSF